MFAKKFLGQNFLKDQRALDRIADVLDVQEEDMIVEIGPGHGELTKRILERGPSKLVAVEKDEDLIETLLEKFKDEYSNLEVLRADALKEIPRIDYPYKLVGNIPYYITGHLLRLLQEVHRKPSVAVFTLQKEVAQRLSAAPPKMNLLSAATGFWADAKLIRYISRRSFKPAPKVDSAIVKITPTVPQPGEQEARSYYTLIKVLFKQPRKTILNNLKALGASKEMLAEAGLDPSSRPQDLDVENIKKLALLFTHNKPQEGYN